MEAIVISVMEVEEASTIRPMESEIDANVKQHLQWLLLDTLPKGSLGHDGHSPFQTVVGAGWKRRRSERGSPFPDDVAYRAVNRRSRFFHRPRLAGFSKAWQFPSLSHQLRQARRAQKQMIKLRSTSVFTLSPCPLSFDRIQKYRMI